MSAQVYPEALPKRGTLAYLEAFPNEVLTMSLDEYWENELKNEYKSEFYKNKVTAIMPYTSEPHNQIVLKLVRLLGDYIDNNHWKLSSETRPVWIPACELNTYPDIFITKNSQTIVRKNYQIAEMTPSVIIEVLSQSTENMDKGEKLRCYKNIAGLEQYILISQDKKLIEIYENFENKWVYDFVEGSGQFTTIAGLKISLDEIYRNIDL